MGDVAALVARTLRRAGADICFGVTGTTNFRLCLALEKEGVRFVAARHEAGAVAMAEAYAKHSGRLALASVHSGPGLTNALTPMAEAAKARTPLVVLAGAVATGDVLSNFHLDQMAVARSVEVVADRLHGPHSAEADVLRACRTALVERRAVLLDMPLDVQEAEAPDSNAAPPLSLPQTPPLIPRAADVAAIADALAAAKRPVIVAGYGAALGGAGTALQALAERSGALLATSARAHGLFSGDPWALGIMGGFATPGARELILQADLFVGFGISFTGWTVQWGRLIAPGARVIQVDHAAAKLAMHYAADLTCQADAALTAAAVAKALKRRETSGRWRNYDTRAFIARTAPRRTRYPDTSNGAHIDPRTLTRLLDDILPADRAIATDGGHFMGWPIHYLTVPGNDAWCFTASFSATGLGLGSAIGLAMAQPYRLTICCVGDGGFMMSIPDLETAVRLKLRLCIVVYNDCRYAAEINYFDGSGLDSSLAEFSDTDFAMLARSVGAQGVTVRAEADLDGVRDWVAAGAEGVMLVDAKVTPDLKAEWFTDLVREMQH